MAKQYINKNAYIGDTGITLADLVIKINAANTNVSNLTTNFNNLKNNLFTVTTATGNKTCRMDTSNTICSLALGAGAYIIFGHWRKEGNVLSSWTSIEGADFTGPVSVYDNSGYVDMTVVGWANGNKTVRLNCWPRGENVALHGELYAIRIK